MSGTLIRLVATAAEIAGTGVYLLPETVERPLIGDARKVGGIVAPFEWGPEDEAFTVYKGAASLLAKRHFPAGTAITDTVKKLAGIPFGRLKVVRITGSGAAKAAVTLDDASTADSLTITALYNGTLGNSIAYAVAANATDATKNDVTLTLGDRTEVHPAVQNADGTVNAHTSEIAVLTKAGSATAKAAAATGVLSSGSSGTLAASDYTTGLAEFAGVGAGVDGVVCIVNDAAGILADVNTALASFGSAGGADKEIIYCTPSAESVSTAVSAMSGLTISNGKRLWPRCKRLTVDGTETHDPNLLYLAAWQRTDPWRSVGGSQARPIFRTAQVVGLETASATDDQYDALEEAGITALFSHKKGFQFRGDVQTDNTATNPSQTVTWSYTNYLDDSISEYLDEISEQPLDIDIANSLLGDTSGATIRAIEAFLEGEERAQHITKGVNDDGSSSPAYEVDPFGEMDATKYSAGRWDIGFKARNVPGLKQLVWRRSVGPGVSI